MCISKMYVKTVVSLFVEEANPTKLVCFLLALVIGKGIWSDLAIFCFGSHCCVGPVSIEAPWPHENINPVPGIPVVELTIVSGPRPMVNSTPSRLDVSLVLRLLPF